MVLTLVAEVLSGETLITPGGAIDMATACGLEAFTWDGWLQEFQEQQAREQAAAEEATAEVTGSELAAVEARSD